MKLNLARAVSFQCAHSYKVKSWSHEENLKEFGLCFSPIGHGHSYRLEAFISGSVDPVTGMIINLRDLDLTLKESVADLEGKFLDKEVPEFKDQVPTTENLAQFLFLKIHSLLVDKKNIQLEKIRLYETEQLWVECFP